MSRETKIKIIGTGIFLVLSLGMIYLIYHTNAVKKNEMIGSIHLSGNNLLSENDYLRFTKLNGDSEIKGLTLSIIKDRFQKHPYIEKADVKFINEKGVKVFLVEKNIYGVIIRGNEPFFITEGFQVLPVFPNTKISDITILSNIEDEKNLKPLKVLKNKDVIQACKILDAAKLTGSNMLKDLAEINLRNGGDVVLALSSFSSPIIFGRNYEAEKMVSLEALLTENWGNNKIAESDYIDLRFYNDIYIGKREGTEL